MAYLKLGVAAVIGLAFLTLIGLWQYERANSAENDTKRQLAEATAAVYKEADAANKAAIQRITEMRARDDEILKSLTDKLTEIDKRSDKLIADVAYLGRTSDETRAYLATRVPPDLASLLNGARRAARGQNGSGGSQATVKPDTAVRTQQAPGSR